MKQLLRSFGISLGLSIVGLSYVLIAHGVQAGFVTLVLAAIELAFSFDNAVINAKVLTRLSPLWRQLFLSVGILIAIFGVRALLPLAIVSLTAHLPLKEVADLAFNNPKLYAEKLIEARPGITAFGGAFLMVLALQFFLADREVQWLKAIERPLARFEHWSVPLLVTATIISLISFIPENQHPGVAFLAGFAGLVTYGLVNGTIALLNRLFGSTSHGGHQQVGWAAFATFMYLELLDASLSFDGVIGAFAITTNVVLIAIGLGIGAVWVRSLTVYMVRHKTLEAYRFLEHGAHYAIAVLAVTMLLAVIVEVPDFAVGALCLGLIAAALVTSREEVEARVKARA